MKKVDHKREEGASIVAILIALAILGIVGFQYAKSSAGSMKAMQQIEEKDAVRSVENAVVDEVYLILKELNGSNCLGKGIINDRPFGFGDASTRLKSSKTLTKERGILKSMAADPAKRCSAPVMIRGADIANAAKNRLYFCMTIDNPPGVKKRARSFLEVSVEFMNSVDSKAVSCKQYLDDPATFARVAYGLYMSDMGSRPGYSKRLGATVIPGGGKP